MAMKLNGCDLITIMKSGRWTSLTFLTYIHNQVAHLGANITHRMAHPVPFFSESSASKFKCCVDIWYRLFVIWEISLLHVHSLECFD